MKIKILLIIIITIIVILLIESCSKDNVTNISTYNSTTSHKTGKNCMDCHRKGRWGTGWFNVAGTVYDSLRKKTYPNVMVRLFSEPNGKGILKYNIQVDSLGNFYTTEYIDFGSGLFPAIEGKNNTKYMNSKVISGACNNCHNTSVSYIWAV